jgi:hypothetical protein
MVPIWIGRLVGRHPGLAVNAVMACFFLVMITVLSFGGMGIPLWGSREGLFMAVTQGSFLVAATVIVCAVGCWLGRSGIPVRRVLRSILWVPLMLLAVLPVGDVIYRLPIELGLSIAVFLPLAVVGTPYLGIDGRLLYPVVLVGSLSVIIAHFPGWLLAECITRRRLRCGKWEYMVEAPPPPGRADKLRAALGRALIGTSWTAWLYLFAAGFTEV